jgi:lipopolysaccharide biosynthesis glycosyltransferase
MQERIRVNSEFVLVTSFDEKYVKLGVSLIASVFANNNFRIHFVIFDTGISKHTLLKIKLWAKNRDIDLTFFKCDYSFFSSVLESGDNVKRDFRYYVRLIAPYIISASKILYMDADIICYSSLKPLFETSLQNHIVAACSDSYFGQFDVELKNWNKTVVNNYKELGLPGNSPYFNSGVLLINTDKWRAQQISEKVVSLSERYNQQVFLWDQYGLNIALHGNWLAIDPIWNYTSDNHNVNGIVNRHFAKVKPTNYFYTGNDRRDFFYYLDSTPFKGWRPSLISAYIQKIIRKGSKFFRQ